MQMGKIFERARRVVVWLGQASMLENMVRYSTDQGGLCDDNALAADTSRTASDRLVDDFYDGALYYRDYYYRTESPPKILQDELIELSESDYWRRLWIIQEIAVARSVGIVASTTFLSIRRLYDMTCYCRVVMEGEKPQLDKDFSTHNFNRVANITKAFEEKKKYTLSEIGHLFRGHQCTDPRDNIYGLLSICKEAHQFTVDYNCAVEELFVHALRVCSGETKSPAISTKDCHRLMRMLKIDLSCCLMYEEKRACALPSCLDEEFHIFWTSRPCPSDESQFEIIDCLSEEGCHTQLSIGSTTYCLRDYYGSSKNGPDVYQYRVGDLSIFGIFLNHGQNDFRFVGFFPTNLRSSLRNGSTQPEPLSHDFSLRLQSFLCGCCERWNRGTRWESTSDLHIALDLESRLLVPVTVLDLVRLIDLDIQLKRRSGRTDPNSYYPHNE